MLSAQQMQSLPNFFADIPDPRRAQGRRHPLPTVLAIAAGATLCGLTSPDFLRCPSEAPPSLSVSRRINQRSSAMLVAGCSMLVEDPVFSGDKDGKNSS